MPAVLIKCPSPDAVGGIIDDLVVHLPPGASVAEVKAFVAQLPGRPRTSAVRVIRAGRVCADTEPAILPGTEDEEHPPTLHVSISTDAWTERVPIRRPASPAPAPAPAPVPAPAPAPAFASAPPSAPAPAPAGEGPSSHLPPILQSLPSVQRPAPNFDAHRIQVIEQAIRSAALMQSLRTSSEVYDRIAASLHLWERRMADVWGGISDLIPEDPPLDAVQPLQATSPTHASWYWFPTLAPQKGKDVLAANAAIDRLLGLPPCPWDQQAGAQVSSRLPVIFGGQSPVELKDEYQVQLGHHVLSLSRQTHPEQWDNVRHRLAYLEWASVNRVVPLRAALGHISFHTSFSEDLGLTGSHRALSAALYATLPISPSWTPSAQREYAAWPPAAQAQGLQGDHPRQLPPWHVQPGPDMRLADDVLAARQALADERARATVAAVREALLVHGPITIRVTFLTMFRLLHILFAMHIINLFPVVRKALKPIHRALTREQQIELMFGQMVLFSSVIYLLLMFIIDYRRLLRETRNVDNPAPNEGAADNNPQPQQEQQAPRRFPLLSVQDAFSVTRWAQWVGSWGLDGEGERLHLPIPAPPPNEEGGDFLPAAVVAALEVDDPPSPTRPVSTDVPSDPAWTGQALVASFIASLWPAADTERRLALRGREEATRSSARAWAAFARSALRQARERQAREQNPQGESIRHRQPGRLSGEEDVTLDETNSAGSPSVPASSVAPRADEDAEFDGWPSLFPLSLAPEGLRTPYASRVAQDILTRQPRAAGNTM